MSSSKMDTTMSNKFSETKIGFIGAGNMAQAIGFSIIDTGLVKANQIMVSAPTYRNLGKWKEKGVNITKNNSEVTLTCDIVFLAMKPQFLESALASLNLTFKATFFISILVGLSIASLKEKFKRILNWDNIEILRVMPNTPIQVGAGCSILCHDENTPPSFIETTVDLMSAGGTCQIVKEPLINAISAVCSSGPAYMYLIIEALSDGAVKVGVPRELAIKLVSQTMIGAAEMVLKTGKHPGELKDNVCSPGGSTIAAMHALEQASVRSALISAVEAANNRAEEIRKKFN